MNGLPGYDAWKLSSPDDEHIPDDERLDGCECRKRLGDFEWCPVHGRDPDRAYDEMMDRKHGGY